MASNMWKPVEDKCEICGAKFDEPRNGSHENDYNDDGTPRDTLGSTIEDDDGKYLTLCEDCLRMITNQEFLDVHQRMVRAEELGLLN